MKKQTVAFVFLSALLLTACGDDDKDRLPSDPDRPDTHRRSDRDYNARRSYHGDSYVVANSRSRTDSRDLQSVDSNSLDTLHVDGKRLPSRQFGIYTGGIPHTQARNGTTVDGVSYKNFLVSGDDYKNSRFGYITHGGTDYVFSQGAFTENMPTSGRARYSGDAAVGRDGIAEGANADFNVNFGNRTVSGRISADRDSELRFDPVYIDARIRGNAFYSDGTVSSSGHFYGKNAREMGGVFNDSRQQLRGSFGATRD